MADSVFKLANPPIIEAVLDIDCDMPPGLDIAKLEPVAFPQLRDHYPEISNLYRQQITAKLDAPEKTSVQGSIEAVRFLHQDKKQLVQIRREGFSFNRLAPYQGFDAYQAEIERVWKIVLPLVKPRQVKGIKLRYINRILLPTTDNNLNLIDYMTVGSSLPEAAGLALMGFLNQYAAGDVKTGNMANVVLTTQPMQADKLPVIFDITASYPMPLAVDDWSVILSRIQQLRELKNSVFKNTLTEKCLSLFR